MAVSKYRLGRDFFFSEGLLSFCYWRGMDIGRELAVSALSSSPCSILGEISTLICFWYTGHFSSKMKTPSGPLTSFICCWPFLAPVVVSTGWEHPCGCRDMGPISSLPFALLLRYCCCSTLEWGRGRGHFCKAFRVRLYPRHRSPPLLDSKNLTFKGKSKCGKGVLRASSQR